MSDKVPQGLGEGVLVADLAGVADASADVRAGSGATADASALGASGAPGADVRAAANASADARATAGSCKGADVAASGVSEGGLAEGSATDAEAWVVRAACCELLALTLRYPDETLAEAVAAGEWREAACEIAEALGLALPDGFGEGLAGACDPDALLHTLRPEATRLFIGTPNPVCSPYEGVWRAEDDGVKPLLFVNPHSMEVERFCRACGLGRPEGTNEPLDHVATEFELLEYLALRAAREDMTEEGLSVGELAALEEPLAAEAPASVESASEASEASEMGLVAESMSVFPRRELPGGSACAAYGQFVVEHVGGWVPRFAERLGLEACHPLYQAAAQLLTAFVG